MKVLKKSENTINRSLNTINRSFFPSSRPGTKKEERIDERSAPLLQGFVYQMVSVSDRLRPHLLYSAERAMVRNTAGIRMSISRCPVPAASAFV